MLVIWLECRWICVGKVWFWLFLWYVVWFWWWVCGCLFVWFFWDVWSGFWGWFEFFRSYCWIFLNIEGGVLGDKCRRLCEVCGGFVWGWWIVGFVVIGFCCLVWVVCWRWCGDSEDLMFGWGVVGSLNSIRFCCGRLNLWWVCFIWDYCWG